MNDRPTDRVADTLTALRADSDRIGLADSGSVRRRGEARTRHQVVGTSLAVVALVAGAIGIGAGLTGGDNRSDQIPASPEPTPQTVVLAAMPLLEAADMPKVGPYDTWQVSPDESAAEQPSLQCLDSPSSLGAAQTEKRFFYTDLEATAVEHVLRFDSAADAQAAQTELRDQLAACSEQVAGDPTVESRTEPVADLGFHVSRTSSPPDSEVSYFELGQPATRTSSWSCSGGPAPSPGSTGSGTPTGCRPRWTAPSTDLPHMLDSDTPTPRRVWCVEVQDRLR